MTAFLTFKIRHFNQPPFLSNKNGTAKNGREIPIDNKQGIKFPCLSIPTIIKAIAEIITAITNQSKNFNFLTPVKT